MSKDTKRISRSAEATKKSWRHRVAFAANVYLDIETGSADTPDRDLERLAIAAVKRASTENRDLAPDELGISIPTLAGGRLYAEPNIDGGLEAFSIEDCYELERN